MIEAFEKAKSNDKPAGYQVLRGWPGHSPDFNCIENFWGICRRRLNPELTRLRENTVQNRELIWEMAKDYFERIPDDEIDREVLSFTTRMQICEQRNGDYTGY